MSFSVQNRHYTEGQSTAKKHSATFDKQQLKVRLAEAHTPVLSPLASVEDRDC